MAISMIVMNDDRYIGDENRYLWLHGCKELCMLALVKYCVYIVFFSLEIIIKDLISSH